MYKVWMLAAAVTLGPLAAHAQATLDRPHQILGEGVQRVVQGNFADAEKKLREALREDPSLREAHYNLGVALREEGRSRPAFGVRVEHRVADLCRRHVGDPLDGPLRLG